MINLSKGIKDQDNKLNKKVKIGAKMKINEFDAEGIIVSFNNNFIASANACNKPKSPTTFGPRLLCIEANTLRSNTVKKATDSKIGKIIGKNFNKSKSKIFINNINNILININIKSINMKLF